MRTAVIVVVASVSTFALAQDKAAHDETAHVSAQELKAKTDYCKTCHGIDGQGFRGSYPMPRLAGQQPEYIENQLKAFIEHRRNNPVMFNVAHVLTPAMLVALTSEFKNLDPKPLGSATKANLIEGKKIYEDGIASANVPPCASCHGPEAKGDGQFPRLAGQLNDYVIRKLTNWDKERGQDKANPDSSTIMQPIAHDLTEVQIRAVAAYVSQLD
ncbi:cytochrome C [Bradyrhizobium sp. CCBAU 51627]|nr:cytochrome C [Bradyrhizobium sp. CCBAU 51627]